VAESAEEVKKATVTDWNCTACTMINKQGGTVCDMCGCKAPDQAYVDVSAEKAKKEAEEKMKTEEEERLAKEKKAEEEKKSEEELKRIEEEKQKEKVRQESEKTKQFLEQSKVFGHLFCSVNCGKDKAPLVVGVLMANSK
jgi:uncharacterized Zn finger protein (UPF0148 family)